MALHRIKALMRFSNASGMAQWALNNLAVRHQMAVHINVGTDAEEPAVNAVVADGPNHQIYSCDLSLMDEAHAIDAFNTLSAIIPWAAAFEDSSVEGFIERHVCRHDETPPQPCEAIQRVQVPA